MSARDYALPDGYRVRLYDFGGADLICDDGKARSITTTRGGCFALAELLAELADGDMPIGGNPAPEDA